MVSLYTSTNLHYTSRSFGRDRTVRFNHTTSRPRRERRRAMAYPIDGQIFSGEVTVLPEDYGDCKDTPPCWPYDITSG